MTVCLSDPGKEQAVMPITKQKLNLLRDKYSADQFA